MTVVIESPASLTIDAIARVAYDREAIALSAAAVERMNKGHATFNALIDSGVACYGVTTGLGKLSDTTLETSDREELTRNILIARAAAIGAPLPAVVSRAMMILKLGNLVSGADGTRAALAEFICERLNDSFTPWVPSLGHGMGADAIAHTHCFQTLIGEGYVFADEDQTDFENGDGRVPAIQALRTRGIEPFKLDRKEGLALLNGIAAAPAFALHASIQARELYRLANAIAATSVDAMAAPKDSLDPSLTSIAPEPGIIDSLNRINGWLSGSEIEAWKLQAPISFRVVPQVHGLLFDAIELLDRTIARQASAFSDNPWMTDDGRLLSVGVFHNQHLVAHIEQTTTALIHVGCLSERRLHRFLDSSTTGLNAQLAARPGLDAGLVVLHKAVIDHVAKARLISQPLSVMTSETSSGQEDYMSMAIPVTLRLIEASELVRTILAAELLAACVALDQRPERCGQGVASLHRWVREIIAPLNRDRAPGPDLENLLDSMRDPVFSALLTKFS